METVTIPKPSDLMVNGNLKKRATLKKWLEIEKAKVFNEDLTIKDFGIKYTNEKGEYIIP
nr:hypothetical protein [uncultured Flavobacterium sp.]